MKIQPSSARAFSITVIALMVMAILPMQAWGASAAQPDYDIEGTRWDVESALAPGEVKRFNELWTARFLDNAGLQAYLNTQGLYDDGFNELTQDQKAALIVGLVQHWQDTLPAFGRDFWTGEAAKDQENFEQLATMLYATIFAKDEFLAALRAQAQPPVVGPPAPVDAGNPEFPGMTQDDIVAYFDSLHAANTIVTDPPAVDDLGVPLHLVPGQETVVAAPPMPGASEAQPPGVEPVGDDPLAGAALTLEDILDVVSLEGVDVAVPDTNTLLNTIAAGTYTACGATTGVQVHCAPVPVPLGVPVALDLDNDLLTGVGGAEVSVLLGPTVNTAYLNGFAAHLRVDRTQPSVALGGPLPAQVFVVYNVPAAATQVMAGFDASTDTLGDSQELTVTLHDVALALAGDINVTAQLTRSGPGSTLTLLSGYAQLDPTAFPAAVTDPTVAAVRFDPVPSTLSVDLRFAELGGERFIDGAVRADLSPTVTTVIDITQGNMHRTLTGIIESMPTSINFHVVSQAVGAVSLDYVANGGFPRFELHDVLVPNVNSPSTYSTLDAVVTNIPAEISFDITRPFRIDYQASGAVGSASIAIVQRDAQGIASSLAASAASVPAQWTIKGTTSPIVIEYSASDVIPSISAAMQLRGTGGVTSKYAATITSIPKYLRLAATPNEIVVDARTSPTAASASGVIGSISAQYTTDGVWLGGAGNHANLYQTSTVTRASIGYSGLKYIRVSQVNDNLAVDVQNSAPRYFTAYADTPEAYLSLVVDSIPAHVSVTGTGTTFTYNAYGATVNTITANFWDKESMQVVGTLRGLPGTATMNVNLPASSVTYSASSAITSIDVDAWIGSWYGMLRLTGIPTAWSANFGGGTYAFDAFPNSIASVQAVVTNHGAYSVLGGNHLNLDHNAVSGITDASLLMTAVQRASYSRSGSNQNVDLRMGGGTPFTAMLEATLANGERAYGYAWAGPLPSSIQATIGEKFTVATNQNFDTYLYGEYGTPAALATTPAPPFVHGFSVRDGQSGAAKALKGSLYLTGLPTSVAFDSRNTTFSFTNWRPTSSTLTVDAELDNFVSPAIDLYVSQSGIPNPQSLTFTMTSADIGGGAKRVKTDLVQTAGMGALYADLVYGGQQHGRLQVSNIPDDVHATLTLANGVTTFAWDATTLITSVYAAFRVVAQSASFQGYVSLTDLPSDFTVNVGRASGGQGPTLSYTANADTLDINAYTDASLFGGDLKARLSFGLTNLGRSANVFASGTGIRFTSSPATGNLFAQVWGSYNYYREGSGTWDEGGFVEFPWAYHVGVNPNINGLSVSLSSFSDFSMNWGVTSKLSGSYGSFSFGWSSFTVDLHAYGKVQIVVDWPWPFGSSVIDLVNIHYHPGTINIDVLFHRYTNHEAYWFGTSGWAICDWSIWMDIRPHPHGATWNSVSTSSATAEGGAWYVTPNPWGVLPSWGVDLAARYTSPDGGAIGGPHFDYDCI